jgi:hypothetical protein
MKDGLIWAKSKLIKEAFCCLVCETVETSHQKFSFLLAILWWKQVHHKKLHASRAEGLWSLVYANRLSENFNKFPARRLSRFAEASSGNDITATGKRNQPTNATNQPTQPTQPRRDGRTDATQSNKVQVQLCPPLSHAHTTFGNLRPRSLLELMNFAPFSCCCLLLSYYLPPLTLLSYNHG